MNYNYPRKILIVDDEANNRLILKSMVNQLGHKALTAHNGVEALNLLDQSFDLVLTDVMMPGINGFELVERLRQEPEIQDIPVIMVTTLSEKEDRLKAVESGANDFISKPVDMIELKVRVASMLKQKAQQDEIKMFAEDLQGMVEERTTELRRALAEVDKAYVQTIQHLSAAAEYKDDDTALHIRRMSGYSVLIAEKMGLDKKEVDLIRLSSPMHDIGKIGIPDHILLKPGKLDLQEWEIMKTHADLGGEILGAGNSDYMNMGTMIALSHHEKWDGSGYPSGLKGEEIPLAGRICAVADVFDALTSKRPYKKAFSVEKAIEIMKEGRGAHFDPNILDVFLANLAEVQEIRNSYLD